MPAEVFPGVRQVALAGQRRCGVRARCVAGAAWEKDETELLEEGTRDKSC